MRAAALFEDWTAPGARIQSAPHAQHGEFLTLLHEPDQREVRQSIRSGSSRIIVDPSGRKPMLADDYPVAMLHQRDDLVDEAPRQAPEQII